MKLGRILRSMVNVGQKLDFYSQFHPSPLSIQKYLDFGRTGDQIESYSFLRKELMVRLANIMKEVALLPGELLEMPSTRLVKEWYQQSFEAALVFEQAPSDSTTLLKFNEAIQGVLERHRNVVETMAEGLIELKQTHGIDVTAERNLQYFLDRFYIMRISIRMLMNQHLMIFGTVLPESPRHVGSIDPYCDVESIVRDAYENAKFLCDRYYLTSPNMKLEAVNAEQKGSQITIVYVPSHLYHIVFELVKNAMRAVVEHYGPDQELPDIKVIVVQGKEDLSIKICDRGGGVKRSILDMLFNYMYTTAPPPSRDFNQAPLAGYGYGLPLARLYTRYFQGDCFLVSMEGHGTDACVYLKALAVEASELLPIYSTASRRQLTTSTQASDWSQPLAWHKPNRAHAASLVRKHA